MGWLSLAVAAVIQVSSWDNTVGNAEVRSAASLANQPHLVDVVF